MKKLYFSYNEIHSNIKELSSKIKIDYNPDILLAISGGGLIPARIMRSYVQKKIICIGLNYYDDQTNKKKDVVEEIQWFDLKSKEALLIKNKNILIIDEIDDTRSTLLYVIEKIRKFKPKNIGISVLYNKKKQKVGPIPNDCKYFAGYNIDDYWVIFPWDALNIVKHNILCDNLSSKPYSKCIK